MSEPQDVKESIKSLLIVGESLQGIHSYEELQLSNIIVSFVLFMSTIFSIYQAIQTTNFWYLAVVSFIVGAIYYGVNYKSFITLAITKYRIIKLETDILSRFLFRDSRLIGFTDLHFEHIESINIGTPKLQVQRLYSSIFLIATGWLLTETSVQLSFFTLIGSLLIILGVINAIVSIPTGGVKLTIQSISGDIMSIPEKKTPNDFIDDLILFCRTFLSYGAT